ncbi:hypothetical protein JK364_24175 [Streptomyces sp. 110]|uniref:Uncharacterized protein n=1 Tax=Streptomyces endocoffeicus TaxID=2898945 RepID=A0ABS1PSQ9_9ACTN|nr:hypothetical protein [Streptomyces endocoffeicus]
MENWFDWTLDNGVSSLTARHEHSAQWSADLNEVLAAASVNQALSAIRACPPSGVTHHSSAM